MYTRLRSVETLLRTTFSGRSFIKTLEHRLATVPINNDDIFGAQLIHQSNRLRRNDDLGGRCGCFDQISQDADGGWVQAKLRLIDAD